MVAVHPMQQSLYQGYTVHERAFFLFQTKFFSREKSFLQDPGVLHSKIYFTKTKNGVAGVFSSPLPPALPIKTDIFFLFSFNYIFGTTFLLYRIHRLGEKKKMAQKRLFKLFPKAAEITTSVGAVPIPQQLSNGQNATLFGLGAFRTVKELFRLEGQALFPVGVTSEMLSVDDDDTLAYSDKTPVAVSVTHYENSISGPLTEVSVCLFTTYHRIDQPLRRSPYAAPFLLENMPATRLYPLMTFTDNATHAAMCKEVYHLPTVHTPIELSHNTDGSIATAEVTLSEGNYYAKGAKSKSLLPSFFEGEKFSVNMTAESEGVQKRLQKVVEIQQALGYQNLLSYVLDGKRELRFTHPHGRGTLKGRALNNVSGEQNPVGVVSGIDLGDNAAKCGADYSMWVSQGSGTKQSLAPLGEGAGASFAEDFGFEGDIVVRTADMSAVRLMPQTPVLPLHHTDHRPAEMKALIAECTEMMDARKPHIELPRMLFY